MLCNQAVILYNLTVLIKQPLEPFIRVNFKQQSRPSPTCSTIVALTTIIKNNKQWKKSNAI